MTSESVTRPTPPASPDFDTLTMTEARAWVTSYVAWLTTVAGGNRTLALESCRDEWTDEAKRAAFADVHDDDDHRTTYLPMLLTALTELEATSS